MSSNVQDLYPLTPLQQGMLFHALYAPEAGLYVDQIRYTLAGDLDEAAFEQAWRQVVARHDVLRSAFVWEDVKEPLQIVLKEIDLPLTIHDLRGFSPAEQQSRIADYLSTVKRDGFDLTKPPLMHLALMRMDEQRYEFVWNIHHILIDGWSVSILLGELMTFYELYSRNQEIELPKARPYKAYIAWLRKQDMDQAEAFWRNTMTGIVAPILLDFGSGPSELNGDSEQSRYLYRQCTLPPEVTAELNAMARQHRLTLNTLIQGAWALLLHRYSGEDDVVFGAVVSGRPPDMAGSESMVGLFINTLPVRTTIADTAQLLPWLEAYQAQQFEARQYEYSSLIDIHGWSDVPRNQPLFESIVVFENQGSGTGDDSQSGSQSGASLQIQTSQHSASHTGYPLTVVVEPKAELAVTLYYDSQRFDAATIDRTLGHLQTLLSEMARGLEKEISTLPILTQREEDLLLREWTNTAADYPRDKGVAQLFAEQAARTPDAIAVEFGEELKSGNVEKGHGADSSTIQPCNFATLTYQQLNERANQLAHYLQSKGVESGSFIGICMERSAEIVIGILGILKAGAAYLPLDPTYPAERLSLMLDDARPKVLLCTTDSQAKLVTATQETVNHKLVLRKVEVSEIVNLSTDAKISQHPTTNPSTSVSGGHLAYVMYTSGSTGRPKGIPIPHRAISRLVNNTNYLDFGPDLRFGMISNTAFDAATFEIWGALLHGSRLIGIPKDVVLSLADFGEYIRTKRIDTMFLTTALFNQMAREVPDAFAPLKNLLFGGEAVDPQAVRLVLANKQPGRLLHVYGPTESTTFATWQLVESVDENAAMVPIGRALSNTQTYVLDRQMRPVPVGVVGELYIGGDGLAHGYLYRAELSAASFVPNPFSSDAGARIYKTGDVVRYCADGAIEFVGRVDNQVKLRGFRIELGEIETVLSQHPAISESIVVVHEVRDKRLVAYCLLQKDGNSGQTVSEQELRDHIQATLPAYMTPAAFILLDALPLTPNGKVDRKALPTLEEAAGDQILLSNADGFVAPRTPAEEMVAAIWSTVLSRDEVGIHDDFFMLGGHSLLATQAISRLREAFGADVPLRLLFESPTVAAIVPRIEAIVQAKQGLDVPPINPAPRDQALPLSFAQQRLWFIDQLEPNNPAYNMPSAVRLSGMLDGAILEASINEIVARHEGLRTTFAAENGRPHQVVHPYQPLTLKPEALTHLAGQEQEDRLLQLDRDEAATSFDLAKGPLFRVRLLRLAETEHVILVNMHHIISDEWSLSVLVREIATLYRAFSQNEPSPLPDLPVQYPDFAYWQRNWLVGEALEKQLTYWRQQLGGNLPVMQLPYDRPQPAAPTYVGAVHSFTLPAEVAHGLKRLGQREGVTLFMTLLAGLQTLLYRTTGQEDVVVGTDVANRNRLETEGLIGFFVNHLVLRSDLGGNPSVQKLLQQVRTTTLEAYAHQDLSFDRLVSELQPERTGSHTPLFQVLFVFGNPTAPTLELPGLTLSPLKSDLVLSKYDLTLFMGEREAGIGGAWRYSTERFDAATIERLASQFVTLLSSIVATPDERVSRLTLQTAAEEEKEAAEKQLRQSTRAKGRKQVSRTAVALPQGGSE